MSFREKLIQQEFISNESEPEQNIKFEQYDEQYDEQYNERSSRKCEIPNYIPHSRPENTNREIWHNSYKQNLIDMYRIVRGLIDIYIPKNKIIWNNIAINNLSKLIYHCSSKYISSYLE